MHESGALCSPLAGVQVRAPGRLHLGFFDPSAALGRRFGSLGLVVDGFETVLELRPATHDRWNLDAVDAAIEKPRLAESLARLRERTGCTQPLEITLRAALPDHAGFGSGTQMALALGRAFAQAHAMQVPTVTLAQWLGRGLRSGIGIAGFDRGGLLVDGGPGRDGRPAAPLARIELPEEWRVLLVLDRARRGLSGAAEKHAIATLPPLGRAQAADICHHVLMAVLPGAAGDDFPVFARGVNRMQQVLGAHYAPAQEAGMWTSPAVARVMEHWRAAAGDEAAIGQTSWGPTGFAIVPSQAAALRWRDAARQQGLADGLELAITQPRNHGAVVTTL